ALRSLSRTDGRRGCEGGGRAVGGSLLAGDRSMSEMAPSRKRFWLRLAIPLVVGLALLVWAITQDWAQSTLVIENRSGQPIPLLQVKAGGETSTFRDVAVG